MKQLSPLLTTLLLTLSHLVYPLRASPLPQSNTTILTPSNIPQCGTSFRPPSDPAANPTEYSVEGYYNLFWTFCISIPVTPIATNVASSLIGSFAFRLSNHPNWAPLRRREQNRTPNRDTRISLEPSYIGPGPDQRTDPSWFITYDVGRRVIQRLQSVIDIQFHDTVYALDLYVYEKNAVTRPTRGTVAVGQLQHGRAPFEDEMVGGNGTVVEGAEQDGSVFS